MIPKRAFWFGVGAAAGAYGSLRSRRELERQAERWVSGELQDRAREVAIDTSRKVLARVADRGRGPGSAADGAAAPGLQGRLDRL